MHIAEKEEISQYRNTIKMLFYLNSLYLYMFSHSKEEKDLKLTKKKAKKAERSETEKSLE